MENSVTVRLPDGTFTFDHIAYRHGALDALLSVWRTCPTDPLLALDWSADKVFRYHISASSLSNVTAYRRELEKFHGNDIPWGSVLHEAIRQAASDYLGLVQSLDPQATEELIGEDMLAGVFPLNRVSMVFGMGGSGKSLAVESIVCAASTGADWLGRGTAAGNILWLDYENEDEGDFGRRRQGMALGGTAFYPGSIRWMPGRGVPLPELAETVGREMTAWYCRTLVVDSVMFACGGDPSKAEIATGFYAALSRLPASTKVLIAHTDKAENDKYAFGSVFWHNGIHGCSWFVKGLSEDSRLNMAWYGRKASNGPRQRDFAVRYDFEDGAIFTSGGDLVALNRETGREPEVLRIRRALLSHGKLTTAEIAEEAGVAIPNVSAWLSKMKKKGEAINLPDRKWAMVEDRQESLP